MKKFLRKRNTTSITSFLLFYRKTYNSLKSSPFPQKESRKKQSNHLRKIIKYEKNTLKSYIKLNDERERDDISGRGIDK